MLQSKEIVQICAVLLGNLSLGLTLFLPWTPDVWFNVATTQTSLTMTDLPGCNSKRRKNLVHPQKETTSPDATLLITKSPNNRVSTDGEHEQLLCTPRRSTRRMKVIQRQCITSTPVQAKSLKVLSGFTQQCFDKVEKISDTQPTDNKSKSRKCKRNLKPEQSVKKRTCVKSNSSHSQSKRGSKTNPESKYSAELNQSCRPRLNLDALSSDEQDESLQSSDLSIELSLHEEPQPQISIQENVESTEEEEDLPSFLMVNTKSSSIIKGGFVWYKLRNFPFWPAMVKSVNHKMKRASIMIVDDKLIQQKRGFHVALKALKPYECEEFDELICKAKEKYNIDIQWSIDLIEDYIMRKGIGSFSGSFLEYYEHNISYPVRRKYQANAERLTFANDVVMEGSLSADNVEDTFHEQQEEEDIKHFKRLLPDRTHAAHNRANEKLVQFIVKQGMVDQHLMAVMCGQQQSKWLRLFFTARKRRIVNIYLEDDKQLDQVYRYLSKLYTTTAETDTCFKKIKSIDHVPFVLDVLLPEAIIHAIAGVDNISLTKAEEKYLKGRCISNRERQEFDLKIEQQMR